ncbi:hypothetical protein SEA_FEFFERHEAD_32 [Mycobacterium phage Fefferhead]|nr:hypothetical protein SEA_FEFFERHEAD_32 [Mycobacterium phage Fefferhead]
MSGEAALSTVELIGMLAGSSVLSAVAGGLLARRRDTFAVFTDAYEALAVRVTTLEQKLESVEAALGNERSEHDRTKHLLRIAVEHIRAVIVWGVTDRKADLPVPPAELMVQA